MTNRPPIEVAFALALLDQEGVGRVTAHRLLERFPTHESLLAYPREQVLIRLKGAPNAERTVARLFDLGVFRDALQKAEDEVKSLAEKHVRVIAVRHPHHLFGDLVGFALEDVVGRSDLQLGLCAALGSEPLHRR